MENKYKQKKDPKYELVNAMTACGVDDTSLRFRDSYPHVSGSFSVVDREVFFKDYSKRNKPR